MTNGVAIQLFGGFQITQNGEALGGFTNTRLQSVLAYLILSRNAPQSRQQLAYLFWPDSTDSQARTNLRNILHLLRNNLPDADVALAIDNTTVHWRHDAPVHVDMIQFDNQMATAANAQDETVRQVALEQAIALYAGDILPGCYDEWIFSVREEWQQRYLSAVNQLIDLLQRQRAYRTALDHAQRLLQYDPLLETTYDRLMQLHAALGDRAAALRIYHLCRSTLDREMGVEPSPTTQATYERLLNLEAPAAPLEKLPLATPLVGRDAAWGALQQNWQQLLQGTQGGPTVQFVMLTGEAGIGKTRLAEELTEALHRQGIATATAYCYPAGGRLAYAPLQSWLRSPDIERHHLALSTEWKHELARLIPELTAETPVTHRPSPLTDAANRRRLFEAVLHGLSAGKTPLLLVLDDIQWCDHDTLDWLEFLMHSGAQQPLPVPILILATLRSGEIIAESALSTFRITLMRSGILHDIHLPRLNEAETGQLIATLTGPQKKVDVNGIYRDTDGIPLFIIETIRARQRKTIDLPHSGKGADLPNALTGENALPAKIQSVVESRLVRLSPEARTLADLAAVVGRAFTTTLLIQAASLDEDQLVQGLDELWQQQIIKEHADRVEETYTFVHDKLREVLYNLLSPMRRRLLHRRVAQALEVISQETQRDASAQIAVHYEQASQLPLAIEWLQRAAHAAHRLSALQDALDHLQHGLILLHTAAQELAPERRRALELPMLMQRGAIYLATKGYAAPEVEEALTNALALCKGGGTAEQRFAVLYGLGRYYLVRTELDKGMEIAQQLMQLAEASQSSDLLVEAYTTMGTYLLHRAEFHGARDYLQRAIALYDQKAHGQHTLSFGQDPGVVSHSYCAWTHWCLGELEEANSQIAQALNLADALGYPYNQVIAQTYAAAQLHYLGDATACLTRAEQASQLAITHGFVLWQAMADFLRGWAQAELGSLSKGLALMHASVNLFRATGAELGAGYFDAVLAAALAKQGNVASALTALEKTFAILEGTQDRWCIAELHRIRGLLLLQEAEETTDVKALPAKVEAARAAFAAGISVAQQQDAQGWIKKCEAHLKQLSQRNQ